MEIEANSIWRRRSDGRLFIVSGIGSTGAGHYVTVESHDNDAQSRFSPITDGHMPKDQFLANYEIT
jgi:hypothetical protein